MVTNSIFFGVEGINATLVLREQRNMLRFSNQYDMVEVETALRVASQLLRNHTGCLTSQSSWEGSMRHGGISADTVLVHVPVTRQYAVVVS